MSAGVKITVTLSACHCMCRMERGVCHCGGGEYALVYVDACVQVFYYAPYKIHST